VAKWTNTTSYPNLPTPADDDLLPIADVSEASGSQQRTITWGQLVALAAAGATIAAADPTAGDDTADGYGVGSLWFNSVSGDLLIATDVTEAAAVWATVLDASSITDALVAGDDAADLGSGAAADGHVLTADGLGGAAWEAVAGGAGPLTINAQTGTSYTPVLGDADDTLVTLTNASAITLTIPTNAAVAYPVGSVLTFVQAGAGAVTIAGDTGVTINGVTPGAGTSAGQWAAWTLTKQATDTWLLTGDLQTIALDADAVAYDNTTSGLAAVDVQEAIDELASDAVNAVTLLGVATKTSGQSGITTEADVTDLSVTVTVPAGRRIKLEAHVRAAAAHTTSSSLVPLRNFIQFKTGSTQLGTVLDLNAVGSTSVFPSLAGSGVTFHEPGAGTITYKVTAWAVNTNTTANIDASAAGPCWLAVYDVGPA
jgi:hypothetical protein